MTRIHIGTHEIEMSPSDIPSFISTAATLLHSVAFRGVSKCRSSVSAARRVVKNVAQLAGDICQQLTDSDRTAIVDYLRSSQGAEMWTPVRQEIQRLILSRRTLAEMYLNGSVRSAQTQQQMEGAIETWIHLLKACPTEEAIERVEAAYRLHIHLLKTMRANVQPTSTT